MSDKRQLLNEFESCLNDFWGESPTKTGIREAWRDFLDIVRESEPIPKSFYTLTKTERERLYRIAGL